MTKKSGKSCNPTGTTGYYSSPSRGEKTKQMKVTPGKESEMKGSRQTKLSFPTAGNDISPLTPSGTMTLKVITPDDHAGTNCIRHLSPPTNPESPQTTWNTHSKEHYQGYYNRSNFHKNTLTSE
jgi:hypothetical protein